MLSVLGNQMDSKQRLIYPEIRLAQAQMLAMDEKIDSLTSEKAKKTGAIRAKENDLENDAGLNGSLESLTQNMEIKVSSF